MVYDVFGQLVADYLGSSGSTLERENIYRGGQLLAVYETGASCYKSISQFVTDFYQGVRLNLTTTEHDEKVAVLTVAQSQGQGQLIAAAQSLGTALFTSSEYLNLNPDTPANRGQFLTDLYAAYLGRVPDGYGYQAWLNALNTGSSREEVRHAFAYSAEFQNDVGQLCATMNSSGIKYVLSDIQGSTRAIMDNNGAGSTIVSRHSWKLGSGLRFAISDLIVRVAARVLHCFSQPFGYPLKQRTDRWNLLPIQPLNPSES